MGYIIKRVKKKVLACNHVVAFHEEHGVIYFNEANNENMSDDCCGGIVRLRYCPFCGENICGLVRVFKDD